MTEENLNLNWHIRRLIIIALNRCPTIIDAASALGISDRQLYNLKADYDIEKINGRWVSHQLPLHTQQAWLNHSQLKAA
jgi:hypothetical protein